MNPSLSLKLIVQFVEQKQWEVRIIYNKLKKRFFLGGEENFKKKFFSPPGGEENFMWRGELRLEVHLSTIFIEELRILGPNIFR